MCPVQQHFYTYADQNRNILAQVPKTGKGCRIACTVNILRDISKKYWLLQISQENVNYPINETTIIDFFPTQVEKNKVSKSIIHRTKFQDFYKNNNTKRKHYFL